MFTTLRMATRRSLSHGPVVRLFVLAAVLLAQTGCATSDSDLDYTRDKPVDEVPTDHSYHGWNNNY